MSNVALGVSKHAAMMKAVQLKSINSRIPIEKISFGKCWLNRFLSRCTKVEVRKSTIYEIKRAKAVKFKSIEGFMIY